MIKIFCYKSSLSNSVNNVYEMVDNIIDAHFIFISHKIYSKREKIKLVNEYNYPIVSEVYKLGREYNKKILYMCGGDAPPKILINNPNILVLNTSVNLSSKPDNEYVLGVSVPDKFKSFLLEPKLSIGFVGNINVVQRKKYIDYLSNCKDIETNFIKRDFYIHKLRRKHIKDFENNMNNNLFTFCYRGRGNFSVRFYETIMRGRIPIQINTDNIYPFDNKINWNDVGLFINEEDLDKNFNLEERIIKYYNSKTKEELIEIQKNNRNIYLTYFYSEVYYEQIILNLKDKLYDYNN